jgi:hypothetical protein
MVVIGCVADVDDVGTSVEDPVCSAAFDECRERLAADSTDQWGQR